MKLSEEKLKEYYKGVAQDLIKDGVAGISEEEIVNKLMNDPDNPFRPLSKEELIHEIELSLQDIDTGQYFTFEEAMEKLRKKRERAVCKSEKGRTTEKRQENRFEQFFY